MDYDYEPLWENFTRKEKKALYGNHRHQMAVHVNGTASMLKDWHVIDVADREFDDIFILDRCERNNRDFVIRNSGDRNVQVQKYAWLPPSAMARKQKGHPLQPGLVCVRLQEAVARVPCRPYTILPLDARGRVVAADHAERLAHLSIGTFRACLYRYAVRNWRSFRTPRPVEVNVVVIRELDPPSECQPLLWVLLTSLPVDTRAQLAHVGKTYELRWRTEDFYRLLKSGYRLLDWRLNSADKIARQLVIHTLAAMSILQLKHQAHLPPVGNMTDEDYSRVKTAMLEPNNEEIDLPLRLFALAAKNGGWLARRPDPIGPTILMRGTLQLLAMLDGFARYGPLIKEAARNPQAIQRILGIRLNEDT